MAAIDEVERLFRHLVDILSQSDPDRLKSPIQISEIYQSVVPYRHHRSALGFDTNEDYEMAVLRFLAGDSGFATIDPGIVQRRERAVCAGSGPAGSHDGQDDGARCCPGGGTPGHRRGPFFGNIVHLLR